MALILGRYRIVVLSLEVSSDYGDDLLLAVPVVAALLTSSIRFLSPSVHFASLRIPHPIPMHQVVVKVAPVSYPLQLQSRRTANNNHIVLRFLRLPQLKLFEFDDVVAQSLRLLVPR